MRILAIPDYVLTTLRSNGYNLTRFMAQVDAVLKFNDSGLADNERLKAFLHNKLSKVDVKDIIILNHVLANSFHLETLVDEEITAADLQTTLNNILNIYTSNNIDINMLGDIEVVEVIPSAEWALLIPKEGFGNLIRSNISKTQDYFLNRLIPKMFKQMSAKDVYKSKLFDNLCRIKYAEAKAFF